MTNKTKNFYPNSSGILLPSPGQIVEIDGVTIETSIDKSIFNLGFNTENSGELFFGEPGGLLDNSDEKHPIIEEIFNKLRGLDWNEFEYDFGPCNAMFKKHMREKPLHVRPLVNQLGFQWETDTIAARMVSMIMGLMCTHETTAHLYQRIGDNEVVHARTYKEIEFYSFDNHDEVRKSILKFKATHRRLETVARVFHTARQTALGLATGTIQRNQASFDVFFLFLIALLLMERGQFVISFATTFTYGAHGEYMPIVNAVTKICQDEYEIHAVAAGYLIEALAGTSEGLMAFTRHRQVIIDMFNEVFDNEVASMPLLMEGAPDVHGVTVADYEKWAYFNAGQIADFLRIPNKFPSIKKSPLSFMSRYMKIGGIQQSLQEEQGKNYKLMPVRRDDIDHVFSAVGI